MHSLRIIFIPATTSATPRTHVLYHKSIRFWSNFWLSIAIILMNIILYNQILHTKRPVASPKTVSAAYLHYSPKVLLAILLLWQVQYSCKVLLIQGNAKDYIVIAFQRKAGVGVATPISNSNNYNKKNRQCICNEYQKTKLLFMSDLGLVYTLLLLE